MDIDTAYKRFRQLLDELPTAEPELDLNESTTRLQLIDPILVEVNSITQVTSSVLCRPLGTEPPLVGRLASTLTSGLGTITLALADTRVRLK